MKVTNKHNLPKAIVAAIKQQQGDYDSGGSFVSASGITKPPRIFWLEKRHSDELVVDATDLIWSLVGSAIHNILESATQQGGFEKAEERLFKEIAGVKFSGKFDNVCLNSNTLTDYKVTSVWSVMGEPKKEWEAQLNSLRYLLHHHGHQIDKLQIVAILRDWSKGRSFQAGYPPIQVKRVSIPLWSLEETKLFLEERITNLVRNNHTPDEALPPCSPEDRWQRPEKYAVMKEGGKRALKLFDNNIDATIFAKEKGGYVEVRPQEETRCLHYCQVAQFCDHWRENYAD